MLGLVAAKAALEDGGYGEHRDFDRDGVSVVVGVTGTQELVLPLSARLGHPIWRRALEAAGVAPAVADDVVKRIGDAYVPWQENSFPGLLGNVVAGRIANRLNLRGTNCAVDAACASSLSAVHLAMMELATGRCEMAVAGGADTLNDIFMYMCFSKTPALSPTGDARPFASNADGTVLGEGVGMVLLKRLDAAERDGDRIYAVLRSMGTSSDGRSQSIYAPHAAGQARALREAYRLAGFGPETVELIEAHGTGTKVGDATEFESLKAVFTESQREGAWCAVGSVKSQIGHTKAAAGVAGLIKAALAIHHRALPPTIKVDEPNPKMGIGESPFYVNTELRPWLSRGGRMRRAAVSAFGFGGSNFHAVLEEHDAALATPAWDGSVEIIALSTETIEDLREELTVWTEFAASAHCSAGAIAFRAAQSRASFESGAAHRLVIVLDDGTAISTRLIEAAAQLATIGGQQESSSTGIYYGTGPVDGKLAFVFPGQGSQYVKMGRDLACTFPEMTTTIANAEEVSGRTLGDLVFPIPTFDEAERARQGEALTRTDVAQPALGAISLGMSRVLERFGVRPDMTAGHSFGELTALCAAGRINEATLHRLSRLRGRLMADGDGDRGTMLAVKAPHDELARVVAEKSIDVVIANRNSPTQCVLSGGREEIARAAEACKQHGWAATGLRVAGAFHSRLMESALQPFRQALEATDFCDGTAAVYANTTASAYPAAASDLRRILGEQLVKPVNFAGEIEAMHAAGARTFVEVGPKSVVTGLVRDILGEKRHAPMALDASAGRSFGVEDLALVLARLAARGHDVDLTKWERPAVEPRVPKMVVPLVGANFRSPRKEQTAAIAKPAAVAAPRTETPAASGIEPKATSNIGYRKKQHRPSESPQIPQALNMKMPAEIKPVMDLKPAAPRMESKPGMQMNSKNQSMQTSQTESAGLPAIQAAVAQGPMQDSMRLVAQGLSAMQRLQQQTAEAHQRFLEGQTQAHKTMQMILESHQRMVAGGVSSAPLATGDIQPTPMASKVSEPATAKPTAPALPQPKQLPAIEPTAPLVAPKPAPQLSAKASQPDERAVAPIPAASATQEPIVSTIASGFDRGAVQRALVEVVCEKTGYPADMIDMGMDIEADLGVDSIKRVEIIAGLEERIPGFGGVKPEYMGSIRTLSQIVDFVAGQDDGTATIADPSPHQKTTAATRSTPTAASLPSTNDAGVDRAGFAKALLGVVAELTGYPLDMLELGMDMEADLGIDSIKRVEILAGVESRMPGLPPVKPEYMGSLRTLAQIADYCVGEMGGASAPEDVKSMAADATGGATRGTRW
ncbi:MAG: acyltransferase domain-containing protein [Planctomycetes bacterium]|nr:acyltransferase domain-containing protein [Planctomycetota bacterium]